MSNLTIEKLQHLCLIARGCFGSSEVIISGGAPRDVLSGTTVKDIDVCYDPRHSNDPQTYGPARAAFLACIAKTAAADRARNPAYQRQAAVNKALEA